MKNLLHWLKYKNQEQIGTFLGEWCGANLSNDPNLKHIDVVIPVPLHPKKLKKRGYNQVARFAQEIAKNLQVAYRDDVLLETINTKTQTKKDRQLRWESSKKAFQVNTTSPFNYKHVLLVDDVITTGATIESCAHVLMQDKDIEVSVLSMAVVT